LHSYNDKQEDTILEGNTDGKGHENGHGKIGKSRRYVEIRNENYKAQMHRRVDTISEVDVIHEPEMEDWEQTDRDSGKQFMFQ
jgi:hypothetical protein